MDIRHADAGVDTGKAADLHILTQRQEQLVLSGGDGALAVHPGAALQGFHIGGVFLGDNRSHALDKVLEQLAVGNKVRLAVDLHHDAHAVDDGGIGHALGGHAAGLLGLRGQALFPQQLDGLIDIAFGLGEGLLAVHHAAAGHFAQVLHISSSKCHNHILL